MTNRERVLALIRSEPSGLTDAEIRERTGINPHQQVNQICRKLAADGLTIRRGSPITNFAVASHSGRSQPSQRRTPATRSTKRSAGRDPGTSGDEAAGVPPLPISSTLFVIPCSAAKRTGGSRNDGNRASVLNSLPPNLVVELTSCRAEIAQRADVDESELLPAAMRYTGILYQEADDALAILSEAGADALIISGGYGVVHHLERIGWYEQKFRASSWKKRLVGRCLAAYAATTNATHVVGLLSSATDYATAFRSVSWPDETEQVLLVSPQSTTGPMVKVPRASGQALRFLGLNHFLPPGWASTDGLGVHVRTLK